MRDDQDEGPAETPGALRALPPAAMLAPAQAVTDAQLVELWLYGRSPHTQRAYRADVARFFAHVGKPLSQRLEGNRLGDLHAFADTLGQLAPSAQARTLSAPLCNRSWLSGIAWATCPSMSAALCAYPAGPIGWPSASFQKARFTGCSMLPRAGTGATPPCCSSPMAAACAWRSW